MAKVKSPLPPLSFRSEDEGSVDVDTAVGVYKETTPNKTDGSGVADDTDRKTERSESAKDTDRKTEGLNVAEDSVRNTELSDSTEDKDCKETAGTVPERHTPPEDNNSENKGNETVSDTTKTIDRSSEDKNMTTTASNNGTGDRSAVETSDDPTNHNEVTRWNSGEAKSDNSPPEADNSTNEADFDDENEKQNNCWKQESPRNSKTSETKSSKTNRSQQSKQRGSKQAKSETSKKTDTKKSTKSNYTESDRFTDSNYTGGTSSMSYTPRSSPARIHSKSKPSNPKKKKSILRSDSPKSKSLTFMKTILNEGSIYRHPTRGSSGSSVVPLPALNTTSSINKVYVDDTEKIANRYPKRDKDFKLEFVYDMKPKYPSHYVPEKMSRREAKVFSDINGVYADYKTQDDRYVQNQKKKEERLKKIEKMKVLEEKEKRREKIQKTLEQYEQLRDLREKFEILSWHRNQTQYITPRVLEHEKLSRHMYGLPESLENQQKIIRNLRRKNKKRQSRIKSH